MWAVQEAGALLAYAITRTITAAETGCVPVVRLVDFIGDDVVLPRIGGALDKLLHNELCPANDGDEKQDLSLRLKQKLQPRRKETDDNEK